MRTFQQVGPLRTYLRGIRAEGKTIAFVPTMGALHEGHISLFRKAQTDCDLVVASIFVNPKQFGPNEDLAAYPRDMQRDLQIASAEGVGALFNPDETEVYPPGFQTQVDVPELAMPLEGAHRPGHFRGVATVVAKLLNMVQPDRAYFGQKDYQQLLIIERMARDLNLQTDIVRVSTARAADGLALSSRNAYLSPDERGQAAVLYRALQHAEEAIRNGATDPETLRQELAALISGQPSVRVEYIALVSPDTLLPAATLGDRVTLLALAARVGTTRLIDNALLAPANIPVARSRGERS